MPLEIVYRVVDEDVVVRDPETGSTYVLAVPGGIVTPAQVAEFDIPNAPRRLRTTDATPR